MTERPAACAPFDEDLSALLDRQLAAEREAEVRAHLGSCVRCREQLELLGRVDTALRRLPAPPASRDLEDRVRERLARAPGAPERRRDGAPRSRRWPWLPAAGLAAAAAAVLTLVLGRGPEAPDPPPEPTLAAARQPPGGSSPEAGDALLEGASVEEIAIVLELRTIEDLDVIERLDFLEGLEELDRNGAG
jgi:hypothetical protein